MTHPIERPGVTGRPLRVLQVNTYGMRGGAAQVAWRLHGGYRRHGLEASLVVGEDHAGDPSIRLLPNDALRPAVSRLLLNLALRMPASGGLWATLPRRILRILAEPRRRFRKWRGGEDFEFPGTRRLLNLFPAAPEIVHAHNLHGGYFDLRLLPELSRRVPFVITLHDAWLLAGHCAHSIECERWKTGCGHCPDLNLYPAIPRDATARNWILKRDLYARSRVYVSTPSRWLMGKLEQSILAPAVLEARIIPNGVDLEIFRARDRAAAREALGLPQDAKVLLFAADGIRANVYKDYLTLSRAISAVAERLPNQRLLFLAVGESAPDEWLGRAEVRFIPYQRLPERVAGYYQAADLYLHAARADTFPNTVLEAMACGTPVVASAVGGIPEQVRCLQASGPEPTGILVPPGDPAAMAIAIERLLGDDHLRQSLGQNAARAAAEQFDLNLQIGAYVAWFREILEKAPGTRG